MSYYDYVGIYQVKLWDNEGNHYDLGSEVPELGGRVTYSILMRDGTYIHIHNKIITGINPNTPVGVVVFDKWGEPYNSETKGIWDEPYLDEKFKPGVDLS